MRRFVSTTSASASVATFCTPLLRLPERASNRACTSSATRRPMCAASSGAEEHFDVLLPDGTPIGMRKPRSLVHRDGDWHRTTHIWLLDTAGRILLQKRSTAKDTFPGRWDVSAAGHIEAGDSSLPSARRELLEELGVQASPSELRFVTSVSTSATGSTERHGAYVDNELQDIYVLWPAVTISPCDMTLQNDEVDHVAYFTLRNYRARLSANDPMFVPRSREYRERFFPWLADAVARGRLPDSVPPPPPTAQP